MLSWMGLRPHHRHPGPCGCAPEIGPVLGWAREPSVAAPITGSRAHHPPTEAKESSQKSAKTGVWPQQESRSSGLCLCLSPCNPWVSSSPPRALAPSMRSRFLLGAPVLSCPLSRGCHLLKPHPTSAGSHPGCWDTNKSILPVMSFHPGPIPLFAEPSHSQNTQPRAFPALSGWF